MKNQEELYEEVKAYIHDLARQCWRQWGGQLEDYNQEAILLFFQHIHKFDQDRACLTTWTYWNVGRRLAEVIRRQHRFDKRERVFVERHYTDKADFSLLQLLANLSQDASEAVTITLSVDLPLHRIRKEVRRILRGAGWRHKKIKAVFKEVQEALV